MESRFERLDKANQLSPSASAIRRRGSGATVEPVAPVIRSSLRTLFGEGAGERMEIHQRSARPKEDMLTISAPGL